MPTNTKYCEGRLGNQIIRNLCVSIIARKNNLVVIYNNYNNYYLTQQKLGLDLFSGTKDYNDTIELNDNNIMEYIDKNIESNLSIKKNVYFQTKECSNYLFNYIRCKLKDNIMHENSFNKRYNTNDDVFIHIRLSDVSGLNPGFIYYDKILSSLEYKKGYISTDSKDHEIIKMLLEKYSKLELIVYDELNTIQFGSTCKYIILSHGSFSACIGYFGFYSIIYYPEYNLQKRMWYGDIFSIPGWNKIEYLK
jgi:hypothetical protein